MKAVACRPKFEERRRKHKPLLRWTSYMKLLTLYISRILDLQKHIKI